MAGFFLTKTVEQSLKTEEALRAFSQYGLSTPTQYQLGDYTLYQYNKLTAKEPYSVETEYGFCAAVGAYIYKGLDYRHSLKTTLKDFVEGSLSLSDMYGQYTLIMYVKNQIYIVSDALSAKHFFADKEYHFFSSLFFAAVAATGNASINDMAVYEKMLTGVIVSPDTLVNEVIQMNKEEQEKANQTDCGITFLVHPVVVIPALHNNGKENSIHEQAEYIREYFNILKPALEEERVDLGLSAGHDSTLLFAAMASDYRNNIHLHTHSTGHVHDREKNAAANMAKVKGFDITIVPTPRLDEKDIDLKKLLSENLVFFDGRTSHDIGGFSATYRAAYRLSATDGCLTTLSGVGGECLRNHYSVKGKKLDAEKFFHDKIYNRSFIEGAPRTLVDKVNQYHISKAEKILKTELHGRVNRINLRRYYSEILMADGQGNVIDAYNTVSKCIAPFLDVHVLKEAYRGLKYLGNCGEYESGIICTLDSEIGSCINANNGYPFNHIPLSLRIKEAIRASVSTGTWEKLNNLKDRNTDKNKTSYFMSVLNKSEELRDAFNSIQERYPDIVFDAVVKGYAMDALVEYLSLTVRKLANE